MTHIAGQTACAGSACVAPSTGWYFRPDGAVLACCTTWHELGRVTGPRRTTLRAIWEGSRRAWQQDALDLGDFTRGCHECGALATTGRRAWSLAAQFDEHAGTTSADGPRYMDFALSNRCNLSCIMCNGLLSSSVRSRREHRAPLAPAYDDEFFAELADFLPLLERSSFKGGEPFLAIENSRVWDLMISLDLEAPIVVTTNGSIWSPRVERYVRALPMSINISIDALSNRLLEDIRVGIHPDQLWENVSHFQSAVAHTGGGVTVSTCIMANNWHELGRLLVHLDQRDLTANLIWVGGPPHLNLLTQPRATVEEIYRSLREEDELIRPRLALNLANWESVLLRLEDLLGEVTEAPESAGGRDRAAPVDARPASELLGRHEAVLSLRFVDDVVARADVIAPAEWTVPASWLNVPLAEIPLLLAGMTDSALMRTAETHLPDGSTRVDLAWDEPGGHCRAELRLDDRQPDGSFRLVVGAPAHCLPPPGAITRSPGTGTGSHREET